jgi:hypothetical protein
MLDAVTGTAKTETGQNTDLNNLLGLAYNGDNVFVRNWWNGLYGVIAQANLVLEKVPGINPMDDSQKSKILGEAKFLRAWSYFYLVRLFGDVPLITKPVTTGSPDFLPSRTPREQVYTQIVADLTEAEGAVLPMAETTGRISMGAVKSLLAEVYLTMAGQPLNKGASHYQLAATRQTRLSAVVSSVCSQLIMRFMRWQMKTRPNTFSKFNTLLALLTIQIKPACFPILRMYRLMVLKLDRRFQQTNSMDHLKQGTNAQLTGRGIFILLTMTRDILH